jgi:hypothetical protein
MLATRPNLHCIRVLVDRAGRPEVANQMMAGTEMGDDADFETHGRA